MPTVISASGVIALGAKICRQLAFIAGLHPLEQRNRRIRKPVEDHREIPAFHHVSLQNFQVRPPEEASLFLTNMILLTLINHIVHFRDWPMVGFA